VKTPFTLSKSIQKFDHLFNSSNMRSIFLSIIPMICASFCFSQNSGQNSEIKIDPRQYVTVLYKKTQTQGRLDTIWNWESRRNVPNQKINLIDIEGEIKVDFFKQGLVKNKEFEGTVSLEAEISGVNGTRKIEVNPYSEIGVQRIPIGIKSEPPYEITKKLLNMISELKNVASANEFNSLYSGFSKQDILRRAEIIGKKREIDSLIKSPLTTIDDIIPNGIFLRKLCKNEFNLYFSDAIDQYPKKMDSVLINSKSKKEFQSNIDEMVRLYQEVFSEERDVFIVRFRKALTSAIGKIDIVVSYLNSFESSGEDAMKALLRLINKDLVNYSSLKTSILNSRTELNKISIENLSQDSLAILLLNKKEEITDATSKLLEYTRFKGSVLAKEIDKIASRDALAFQKSDTFSFAQERLEEDFRFSIIEKYLQELSEVLSIKAGEIVYKKLVFATIDLSKSGAKNGEVLNVYLTWILDSKRDSLANSPRLPIGKYYLRETGWRTEIADMFALIKRVNEENVDQSTVSPSNFKGSGGAVLMWTFNKQDRGLIIRDNGNSEFTIKKKNRFVNFLEPSFGLNVSYLDFSTEKDVEIGTGLQIGLFKNKLFFGYGVNLHMLSPKKQSPNYFYIGFSFAKISDLFRSSNNLTSVQ
jgi:hypothetical protein